MAISVFDLFKIGIGPSSSHTVGPMRAARQFATALRETRALPATAGIRVELLGSLGATGKGHASDKAVLLGLEGEMPDRVDPESIDRRLERIRSQESLRVLGIHPIAFHEQDDLIFSPDLTLPFHPNGMRFAAHNAAHDLICRRTYFSVGGGFVVAEQSGGAASPAEDAPVRFPFKSGEELLWLAREHRMPISRLMMENEKTWRAEPEVRAGLLHIWDVMQACVRRGYQHEGLLPGGLGIRRRAPELYRRLTERPEATLSDPLSIIDWVDLYALAVNEENAAGGRVVTAPTNGAAGIIPAVLHYWDRFGRGATPESIVNFILTAGAIGILFKENASISAADVGCQGEVGVACSMAAAGLAEVAGGTPEQVENAA
ncbi:MAG: L-serine ammonia-lyase, partial [Anaerolineae bacterium]